MSTTAAEPIAAPSTDTKRPPPTFDGRMRFTCEDYHRMGEAGIFHPGDRIELLDGEIIHMTPIGGSHMSVTDKLTAHFMPRLVGRYICRVQGSVRINGISEPEPDLLVLNFDKSYYADRLATAADVVLLIEVADSSRGYDLGQKRAAYAKASIVEYWVADLTRRELIVHRDPQADGSYAAVTVHRQGETVAAQKLPAEGLDLAWLFG